LDVIISCKTIKIIKTIKIKPKKINEPSRAELKFLGWRAEPSELTSLCQRAEPSRAEIFWQRAEPSELTSNFFNSFGNSFGDIFLLNFRASREFTSTMRLHVF